MNGTDAPLDMVNDPWAVEPTAWLKAVVPIVHVCGTDPPPAVTAANPPVPEVETPLICTLHAVGVAFEEPVFCRPTTQSCKLSEQTTETADTCAELVNDPNRPNTNPAMAMAAIRVMAMRMTVASTGEMAFLFLR